MKPNELIPGVTYRVEFEDCCARGFFVSKFVEIKHPGYEDGTGDADDFEALSFEHGEIGPDWGSWTISEVAKND